MTSYQKNSSSSGSILLPGPLFDSVDKIVVELACDHVRPAPIRGNRLEDDRVGGCEPLCREGEKTTLPNSAVIRLPNRFSTRKIRLLASAAKITQFIDLEKVFSSGKGLSKAKSGFSAIGSGMWTEQAVA